MGAKNGAAAPVAGERGEGAPRSDRARSQDCSRRMCELLDEAERIDAQLLAVIRDARRLRGQLGKGGS